MKHSTDKYGAIVARPVRMVSHHGCAVPHERRDAPPHAITLTRRLDAPIVPLDTCETPRERDSRLALARARFIHHERERARAAARETNA